MSRQLQPGLLSRLLSKRFMQAQAWSGPGVIGDLRYVRFKLTNWRGRDGNDPSVDIAKDADQRF
jgi:hypothetical protein